MSKYGTVSSNSAPLKITDHAQRPKWNNRAEYLLSCLGYAVGLGNVWRFPYLCYKNGGGVFFVPYTISLFVVGIPLFLAELAIGQYSRQSALSCWNFAPIFRGVGAGMCTVSGLIGIYYIVIIAWSLLYLFDSMVPQLKWSTCGDWSTIHCQGNLNFTKCLGEEMKHNEEEGLCYYNGTAIGYINKNFKIKLPAAEYLERKTLQTAFSPGIHDIGKPIWQIVLCLILAWILIGASLIRGIKSLGKVVYFTATFPYFILLILFFNGVALEGAGTGIKFYLKPDFSQLSKASVWKDALTQIFFSLGVGWGCLITFASYNNFHANVVHDTLIISLGNCLTSVFAGFVVFSYLGHFAHVRNQTVDEVVDSGLTLAFAVYPQALSMLTGSVFFSICFFAMLLTLGFDSEFSLVENCVTTICDVWHLSATWKQIVLLSMCVIMFLLGLSMTPPGGPYVLTIFDNYAGGWNVCVLALLTCAAIMTYGPLRFTHDIECMIGPTVFYKIPWSTAKWFFIACWAVICPVLLLFVMIFGWVKYKSSTYGNIEFPLWADAFGWILTFTVLIFCFGMMVYDYVKTPGTLYQKVHYLTHPNELWVSGKTNTEDEYIHDNVRPASREPE